MSQLLHAGIVAARRQLAALVVFTLVLLLTAQITENSWPSPRHFYRGDVF